MSIGLGGVEGEHFFVVGVDEVDQLIVVSLFLVFVFELRFAILETQFFKFSFLGVDLSFQLFLPTLVIF